jgi:sugar O-acyltransferase (sialic acid O-acetyltransferase NeuD family)
MKRLALFGFGGHGKVVADAAIESGWKAIRFYDDAPIEATLELSWENGGTQQSLFDQKSELSGFLVTIGTNKTRLTKIDALKSTGVPIVSVIHPKSTVSRYVQMGEGSVVFAGAVVNVHSRIGEGVIINTGATVDHDCYLDDGVHISPGAHLAGNVRVGKRSWIGIGAVVKQGIVIGDDCVIGAGAVVLNNVESGLTVVGVPAKPLMKTIKT